MYHRSNNSRGGAYIGLIGGRRPFARAEISGSIEYPSIKGGVDFYATPVGIVVCAEVSGLPYEPDKKCASQIYGLHIHNVGRCTGSSDDPFGDAGEHFDKSGCAHPNDSGDLPPLFGNHGYAWCAVLTDRFSSEDVIGRSVIVHLDGDCFKEDVEASMGKRIACGIIMST